MSILTIQHSILRRETPKRAFQPPRSFAQHLGTIRAPHRPLSIAADAASRQRRLNPAPTRTLEWHSAWSPAPISRIVPPGSQNHAGRIAVPPPVISTTRTPAPGASDWVRGRMLRGAARQGAGYRARGPPARAAGVTTAVGDGQAAQAACIGCSPRLEPPGAARRDAASCRAPRAIPRVDKPFRAMLYSLRININLRAVRW